MGITHRNGCTNKHANGYGDEQPDTDSHTGRDGHAKANQHTYSHAAPHPHCHSHTDSDGHPEAN